MRMQRSIRHHLIEGLAVPVVFILSIAVSFLSVEAAMYSWLLLVTADGPLGDSGSVDRRRRGPDLRPERLAAGRLRRADRLRSVRRPLPPVLRRDLVPDGLPLPGGGEAMPRAAEADDPDGTRGPLRPADRRHPHRPDGRSALLPRRRSLPPQRLRPRPGQHLPGPDRLPRVHPGAGVSSTGT